jgi:hypothetical protein
MKRLLMVATAFAACLIVPLAGMAAGPPDVVCTTSFTGTAHDLVVPDHGACDVNGATITHDIVLRDFANAHILHTSVGHDLRFGNESGAGIEDSAIGHDLVAGGDRSGGDVTRTTIGHDLVAGGDESGAGVTSTTIGHDLLAQGVDSGFGTEDVWIGHDFVASGEESGADLAGTTVVHDVKLLGLGGGTHMERTTIGHDFFASRPQSVQTGRNGPNTPGGPVNVVNDFTIEGSPPIDEFPFVFDGMCDLNVGHDLSITNRSVTLGTGLGGNCVARGDPGNTIGRDLIFTGNHALNGVFGPSSLQLTFNHVGRDLVFASNTAVPGGMLEVSGNAVTRDATCAANNPAVTVNTPNTAGRSNTCG